jgi:hypothetical protein
LKHLDLSRKKDTRALKTRDEIASFGFWRVFNASIWFLTGSRRFTSGYHLNAPAAQRRADSLPNAFLTFQVRLLLCKDRRENK